MRYLGSKARHARYIVPFIMNEMRHNSMYCEPFVGGANVLSEIPDIGLRLGVDINPYIIALLKKLSLDWKPPEHVSEEEYRKVKANPHHYDSEIVGYCGTQCSYGSTWFGGYARGKDGHGNPRDFPNEAYRNCVAQSERLRGAEFMCLDYRNIGLNIESIIYCDPPYEGTIGYMDGRFDSHLFWRWAAQMSDAGHKVFVSEFTAPSGWRAVWSKETAGFHPGRGPRPTENLFVREP